MEFRGVRLGAVIVPLAVAILPVSVLAWYNLVRIPDRENYLNERNLRLLMTLSGDIKTKVDNFDNALDHAEASFQTRDEQTLRLGVRLFAPELDILAVASDKLPKTSAASEIEPAMLAGASDPPRIRTERDEGRSYLYLGARLDAGNRSYVRVVARTDIESVVAPFLEDRREFDAVLLATETGDVIAQKSPVGLSLASIDSVLNARRDGGAAKDRSVPPPTFAALSQFSNVTPVRIGEADYKLYMQPVPLSLLSAPTPGTAADTDRRPGHWVLCGLVRSDKFRQETSALSYTALLWFSAALATFALAIPFVKLRVIKPRERLRSSDAGWVTAMAFAATALLAFGLLDVTVFGYQFRGTVDARLRATAKAIKDNLAAEVREIDRQGEIFDIAAAGELADSARLAGKKPKLFVDLQKGRVSCEPQGACRSSVLDEWPKKHGELAYPFFYLVSWTGVDFWQRVKWSPSPGVTPFVNIKDENVPYYRDLQRAWQDAKPGRPDNPSSLQPRVGTEPRQAVLKQGVSVLASPNTGEPLTVFWRARADKWNQSLATFSPISLDRPTLPWGVSFAVVDRDGRTIFHSDPRRRLQENFVKECEDNVALKSAIRDGREDTVTVDYLGRPRRLWTTPLTVCPSRSPSCRFEDPSWSLVLFQDSAITDTVNLETLTVGSVIFAIYGGVLALVALLVYASAPDGSTKWLWPNPGKRSAYIWAVLVNGAAIVVFIVCAVSVSPERLLMLAAALTLAATVLTWQIVVRSEAEPITSGAFGLVHHPYFCARAAFLLVLAGLPAVASFRAAYAFEMKLLATHELNQEQKDAQARSERIDRFVDRFKLRDASTIQSVIHAREKVGWDRVHAPLWPALSSATGSAPGTYEAALTWMHRLYSDVANDLKSAADSDLLAPAPSLAVTFGWLVAIVGLLFCGCCAFVYLFMKPLFVLDAAQTAAAPADDADWSPRRIILVGPPGSGKSTKLASDPAIQIFDVATQAYCHPRKRAQWLPAERRAVTMAVVGAGRGAWASSLPEEPTERAAQAANASDAASWADAFDYATLPAGDDAALGVDHLDHRLQEPGFAAQTLTFLERVVARGPGTIRIVSDRDPLLCLRESGAPAAVLDRWTRALRSFRKEVVGIGRGSIRESDAATAAELDEYESAAEPYYEALWQSCSADERLALWQLANEGLVNPQNHAVARRLLQKGLIVREPIPRVMNEPFRRFVLQSASPEQVSEWERIGVQIPWGSIETAMLMVVISLVGLLVVTQEQLLSAWIGAVPTIVPAVQKAWKFFAEVDTPTKHGIAV